MNGLTIPRSLVEQLCKGNCVLFVGAGISMGQGGLPGGGQLAQELAQYQRLGGRVVRGGSFSYDEVGACCSYRLIGVPDYDWFYYGCRVRWCAAP